MRTFAIVVILLIVGSVNSRGYHNKKQSNKLCTNGLEQSPINIIQDQVQPCDPDFSFDISVTDHQYFQPAYKSSNLNLQTPFENSYIHTVSNGKKKTYRSENFHLHHESEHQINGQNYDIEVTVVHTAKDKSTAKFSILFKEESGDFPDLFDNWILDAKKGAIQTFPFDGITPPSVYHYQGSETVSDSGDCAEGVEWFVSGIILPIKQSTHKHLASLINGGKKNNRPVQELNDRKVYESGKVCSKKPTKHRLSGHHHK